jgi:hypothetical protein
MFRRAKSILQRGDKAIMPFASKEKRNEYQREYKRKIAAELKELREKMKVKT